MTDPDSTPAEPGFDEWAILELMGHRRLAGRVTEQEIAGRPFLRLDTPADTPLTQFYAPQAVYCLTPCDEATARAVAKGSQPAPVRRFELTTGDEHY